MKEIKDNHFFLIRYLTEKAKRLMVEYVLRVIKDLEIEEYLIKEKKAFMKNRILYNNHTVFYMNDSYEKFKERVRELL